MESRGHSCGQSTLTESIVCVDVAAASGVMPSSCPTPRTRRDHLPGLSAHQEALTLSRGHPGHRTSSFQRALLPSPGGPCARGSAVSPGRYRCTGGPQSRATAGRVRLPVPPFSHVTPPPPPTRPRGRGKKYTVLFLPWASRLGWSLAVAPVVTPWGSPAVLPCSTSVLGTQPQLAGVRKPGWNPGLRGFVSKVRSWGPESDGKCHRGPTGCPGKGWCAAGRAPNMERGGRRSSSHGGPRPHTPSWSLSLCWRRSTFGENKPRD